MSLVSTLGKMAVGMLVSKGISKITGGGGSQAGGLGGLLGSLAGGSSQSGGLGGLLGSLAGGGNSRQSGGGLNDILGSLIGGNTSQRNSGGLDDILGSLMGGGKSQSSGGMGGLGSLIGALAGGSKQSNSGGGLGDIIGMLGGSSQSSGGGLGGILDSLAGSSQAGGLGNLLNDALQGKQSLVATPDQEKQAEIMLRAIISAAKADGEIDAEEQKKISEHLDDVTPDELELVRSIMQEPNDINSLVNSIPTGMEQQAYFMSLLTIDLDSQVEAQYLDKLAKGLNISHDDCNRIHEKAGAPTLYN